MIRICNAVESCLELRSPCVSLKIIAHLRTFFSQSDSSIQRPRSINCFTAYLPANQNPVFRRTMVQIYSNRESTQKCICHNFLKLLQTCMSFVLLLNTKDHVLKNVITSAGRYTGSYRIPVFIFLTI